MRWLRLGSLSFYCNELLAISVMPQLQGDNSGDSLQQQQQRQHGVAGGVHCVTEYSSGNETMLALGFNQNYQGKNHLFLLLLLLLAVCPQLLFALN